MSQILGRVYSGVLNPQGAIEKTVDDLTKKAFGKIPSFQIQQLFGDRPWPYPELGYLVKYNSPRDYIQFHMNPTEYKESYGATYPQEAIPGRDNPLLQYGSGNKHTITMELLLNDWFNHMPIQKSTEEAIQWLFNTTKPEEDRGNRLGKAPALLNLVWGNVNSSSLGFSKYGLSLSQQGASFKPSSLVGGLFGKSKKMSTKGKFVMENIDITRQIVDRWGTARRALVNITLVEYKEAPF